MLYMVTFTINIPQMLAYMPYMDTMGNHHIVGLLSNIMPTLRTLRSKPRPSLESQRHPHKKNGTEHTCLKPPTSSVFHPFKSGRIAIFTTSS